MIIIKKLLLLLLKWWIISLFVLLMGFIEPKIILYWFNNIYRIIRQKQIMLQLMLHLTCCFLNEKNKIKKNESADIQNF